MEDIKVGDFITIKEMDRFGLLVESIHEDTIFGITSYFQKVKCDIKNLVKKKSNFKLYNPTSVVETDYEIDRKYVHQSDKTK